MLNDTKPVVLIFLATVIVAVITATTVLILDGYGESAATLGAVLVVVVPLLFGQVKIHATTADTNAKVDTILNGGSSAVAAGAVDRVVEARVAEHDAALDQLAAATPEAHADVHAQRLADVEAHARKSRP